MAVTGDAGRFVVKIVVVVVDETTHIASDVEFAAAMLGVLLHPFVTAPLARNIISIQL